MGIASSIRRSGHHPADVENATGAGTATTTGAGAGAGTATTTATGAATTTATGVEAPLPTRSWRPIAGWTVRLTLLGASLMLAALTVVPAAMGYQRYVIDNNSMGSTIARGSLVYDSRVPVSSLHVGDVITYRPPVAIPPPQPTRPLTHRIARITHDVDGNRVFQTRGDADRALDPWPFTLAAPSQAKVGLVIPLAGYLFMALDITAVRVVVIGGLIALLALRLAVTLVQSARSRRNALPFDAEQSDDAAGLADMRAEMPIQRVGADRARAAALAAVVAASAASQASRDLNRLHDTTDVDSQAAKTTSRTA